MNALWCDVADKFVAEGFGPSGIEAREFDTLAAAVEEAYWARMERRWLAQVVTTPGQGEVSGVVLRHRELASKMKAFGRTVEP
jgi:hypothetical protein